MIGVVIKKIHIKVPPFDQGESIYKFFKKFLKKLE